MLTPEEEARAEALCNRLIEEGAWLTARDRICVSLTIYLALVFATTLQFEIDPENFRGGAWAIVMWWAWDYVAMSPMWNDWGDSS